MAKIKTPRIGNVGGAPVHAVWFTSGHARFIKLLLTRSSGHTILAALRDSGLRGVKYPGEIIRTWTEFTAELERKDKWFMDQFNSVEQTEIE